MLKLAERIGDLLLERLVPRIDARAESLLDYEERCWCKYDEEAGRAIEFWRSCVAGAGCGDCYRKKGC
ncbi:hypothetical protein [Amycolatopsis magusensis]|uniref:Uncharacterized protein n=1 Tax=Amycolatopsis magusensis TaxID=882444 RepID=A0ABS4PTN3_9PSEU|nr:hypothetical protein [Amycolatopsis magusensis]MBP2182797.1 hypothetical protein [Amycolatopsis magusensis]MDI5982179.1 hypothetical protein [Amycolatopsis magusensis]